jgi:hypothetical protein
MQDLQQQLSRLPSRRFGWLRLGTAPMRPGPDYRKRWYRQRPRLGGRALW